MFDEIRNILGKKVVYYVLSDLKNSLIKIQPQLLLIDEKSLKFLKVISFFCSAWLNTLPEGKSEQVVNDYFKIIDKYKDLIDDASEKEDLAEKQYNSETKDEDDTTWDLNK